MLNENTKCWVVLEGKYELGRIVYKKHLFKSRKEAEEFKLTLELPNQLFQLEQLSQDPSKKDKK